ncbi:hypothetical protein B842_03415 [Corynebacterium humireducens NBRC 106098 = DSM 45392]|uniref:Uncharacterized protein n=1 Tax=Corynebacterium humireducens NBRC 106098 = DSM 45392 TaxID=1223515 RepID=A0A0B5D1M1_9CORY|nr:hypothetical protein [Corynebacterium humireducens]AJE32536.1 hypothetical protein B842_03415 [Corynebacterium humireducens NBRC 106098 = DSM 45392]
MLEHDRRQAAIRHLAGRIAVELVWPNPDLTTHPEQHAAHLITLVCNTNIDVGLAALAVAGPLIADLHGHPPNINLAAALIEDTLDDHPDNRLGHDIGIGFCRHVFNIDTIDQAIDFFGETIADPTLTQEQADAMFLSALSTILTIYATAF